MEPDLPNTAAREPSANSLVAYLRSIGRIPVLSHQEVWELAGEREEAERQFRQELLALPATARVVLQRWRERRDAGLATGVLSGRQAELGRESSATIDAALRAVERRLEERERAAPAGVEAAQRKLTRALERAELDLSLLLEIHREFQRLLAAPRTRPVAEARRRLGLTGAAVRSALARAEHALQRYEAVKRRFVRHNLKLVVTLAKRYRNMGVSFTDLIQEGNLGLIRAVEKFDRERGFKFSTYAVWWIHQSLIRAIQNTSRTVRVPSHVYDQQLKLKRVEEELRGRLRREPERLELAAALKLAPEDFDRLQATTRPITSIHAPLGDTEDLRLEDSLEDETVEDPVEALDRGTLRTELERLLHVLPPRERRIVDWRFGLSDQPARTLEEIGGRIGLSRERVRQLVSRALRRMREHAESEGRAESLAASAGSA